MAEQELTLIKPDFESIRQMFVDKLGTYAAWKDLMSAGTGSALLDFISAVGANDQYAIQHAFREGFRTARLDSSVLAQTVLLGVRLDRKGPGSCQVQLSSPVDVVIPRFSQFSSNTRQLFNRETLTIKANTPITVVLHEGTVKTQTLAGTGLNYQLFVGSEGQYTVSDFDVEVQVNGIVVKRSVKGLWVDKDGYQDFTNPEGQMNLLFGNNTYGVVPPTNAEVKITYAVTLGTAGNDTSFSTTSVVYTENKSVSGKALTPITGGADEKPISLYRRLTPQLFAAKSSASTAEEYPALATKYPGVLDALILGQRSVAPADVRWMNLLQTTLLTETPWDDAQWKDFVKWFQKQSMQPLELYRRDPEVQDTSVFAILYCHGRADLNQVRLAAEKAIRALFAPRAGLLQTNIYLSDIYDVLKKADSSVEYLELVMPTNHVIVTLNSPDFAMTAISGTLPASRRCYAVTALLARGETTANFSSVSVVQNSGVVISWTPVRGAVSYRIYGGTPDNIGLLAEVDATQDPKWTDDGTKVPAPVAAQAASTIAPSYAKLSGLNIQTAYTDRELNTVGITI